MSSSNFEDTNSVKFNIPFHKNCPDFIKYTQNIQRIKQDTYTNIRLHQIVRISGNIKNIKEAHERVSQLCTGFDVNLPKNENQDVVNNFENTNSVEFNIPFHKNCPDFIEYTQNINRIKQDTYTNIQLLQIVRISGDIKNIKEAHQRVSQLCIDFDVNLSQNENQDVIKNLKNKVHVLQSEIQDMKNSFDLQILELTNTITNYKFDMEAIITKLQENIRNEEHKRKDDRKEMLEIKNTFDQKVLELTNAIENNKLQMEAIDKNKVLEKAQNEANAIENNKLQMETIDANKVPEEAQNEDVALEALDVLRDKNLETWSWEYVNCIKLAGDQLLHTDTISDYELETFYKSCEYVNCKKWDGDQPLHIVCSLGRLDMVKKLIQSGIDVNIKNNRGLTPLHYASCNGRKSIVEYLCCVNADVNIKSVGGSTALSVARGNDKNEIIKILKNNGATT